MEIPTKEDFNRVEQKLDKILKVIGFNAPPVPLKQNEDGVGFALEILREKAGLDSLATLYKWSHEGRIPCKKRGKKLWFYRDQLESWIEDGMPHTGLQKAANRLANLNQ